MTKMKEKSKKEKNGTTSKMKRSKKSGDHKKINHKFEGRCEDINGNLFNVSPDAQTNILLSTQKEVATNTGNTYRSNKITKM